MVDKELLEAISGIVEQSNKNLRVELKGDMESLRTELKGDMESMRAELISEMDSRQTELKEDMGSLRTELKGDMESLRTELKGDMASTYTGIKMEMRRMENNILSEVDTVQEKSNRHYRELKGEVKEIRERMNSINRENGITQLLVIRMDRQEKELMELKQKVS